MWGLNFCLSDEDAASCWLQDDPLALLESAASSYSDPEEIKSSICSSDSMSEKNRSLKRRTTNGSPDSVFNSHKRHTAAEGEHEAAAAVAAAASALPVAGAAKRQKSNSGDYADANDMCMCTEADSADP